MSSNSTQNDNNQEIDLGQMMQKAGGIFQRFVQFIFRGILFLWRHKVKTIFLFIIGVALGFYADSKKTYDTQIIVRPNFGSVDYVYAKIELLNSKVKENDTVFLKGLGIKDSKKIGKIKIEPIIDVYKFVEDKERNFELIKLMSEDGNIDKVIEGETTSKNYNFHKISFLTSDITTTEKTVQPILNYLNTSDYFQVIQKEVEHNINDKIKANNAIIGQIDTLLNKFTDNLNSGYKSDKLVYYNENTQLNEIIRTKENLIRENGIFRIELVNNEKIVKDISSSLNLETSTGLKGKNKFIYPVILIVLFLLGNMVLRFSKAQIAKIEDR